VALPASIALPPKLALAKVATELPAVGALPGGCVYEPKWDGFRVVIVRDADVTLWSRRGTDLSAGFPELHDAAAAAVPPGCIIDGEAVVWGSGRLDFDALQRRLGVKKKRAAQLAHAEPASFVAFDVLAVAGHDVRLQPLSRRRELLEELARSWQPPLSLSPLTRSVDEAEEWAESMAAAGIEGIIAKGSAQPYLEDQRLWVKVKRRQTIDVVAGAVIGPMRRPEAVVVGLPFDGELHIVGRSVPLRAAASRALGAQLHPPSGPHPWPAVVSPGAVDRFNAGRDPVQLTLVDPIVVEISADVALSGRAFRHGVRYLRARPELDVSDVTPPDR
jgi:ATP-dependent DNA ligase